MQSGFRVFGTMVSYARIRGFRFSGLTVFLQRKIQTLNNPQVLEITGLLGRFGLFLLGVLQDERV